MSLKIALLASGRGSNVQAILQAIDKGQLNAQVQCLIVNIADAPVLDLGREAKIPTYCIPHAGLAREVHEQQVLAKLKEYDVDYVVMAGYMRFLTPVFFESFQADGYYRIVNIHPSLLPAFPGISAYEEAYAYGVKVAGITVHFVDETVDTGPIILQEFFPRLDTDSLADFKARGLAVEHQIYPQALQILAEKRFAIQKDATSGRSYVEVKSHAVC